MNEILVCHNEQELLSADHAVIFPAVKDVPKIEYLRAVGSVIGTRHIHSVYQNDDYVKIYLKSKNLVSTVIDADINVKGFRPLVNHTQTLSTIILSNVDPTIPDSYIKKLLQSYGIIRSSITRKKLSDHNDFSHIISGELQVILEILPGFSIPNCLKFTCDSVNHEVFAKIESHITVNNALAKQSSSRERLFCFDSLEENAHRSPQNSSLRHSDNSSQSYSNGHKRERRKYTLNIKSGDSIMIPFPWENVANKSLKHITELQNHVQQKCPDILKNNETAHSNEEISHKLNNNLTQMTGCDAQVCFNADIIDDNAPIEILSASSVLEAKGLTNNGNIHFNSISNPSKEVNHSSSISINNTRCKSRKNTKEFVDEISIVLDNTNSSCLTAHSNVEEIFVVTDENNVPNTDVRNTDNKRRHISATSKETNKPHSKSFKNKLHKMECVNNEKSQRSTRTNQFLSKSSDNIEPDSIIHNQCFKEHPIILKSIEMIKINNTNSITEPVVAFNKCSKKKGKHSKRNSKYLSCTQTNSELNRNIISLNNTDDVTVSWENESSYHTTIKNTDKHSNFSNKTTSVKSKHKRKVIKSKISKAANAKKAQTLLIHQATSNSSHTDPNAQKLSVTNEVTCEELNCNFIFSSNSSDEIEVSVINLKKDETTTNTIIEQAAANKTAENEIGKLPSSMLDNSAPDVHIDDQSTTSISLIDNNKADDDRMHIDAENIAVLSQRISNCEKKDACCSPIKLDESKSLEKSETLIVSPKGRKKRKQTCKRLVGRKKQKLVDEANSANGLDQCQESNLSFSFQFGNTNTENHNLELNNQVPIKTFESNSTDKVHIDIDSDSDTLIIGSYLDDPKEDNEPLSGESCSKGIFSIVKTTDVKSSSDQSLKEVDETDGISQSEVSCESSSEMINTLNENGSSSNMENLANKNVSIIAEGKSKRNESSECAASVSTTQKDLCLLQGNAEAKVSQNSEKLNCEQLSKQLLSPNKILRSPSKSPKAKKAKDMGMTGISLDDSIEEFDFSLPPSTINEIESYLLVDLPNSNLQDDPRNNNNPNACQKLDDDSITDCMEAQNSINEREPDQDKNRDSPECSLSTDNLSSNLNDFNASSPNYKRCDSDSEKGETAAIHNSIDEIAEASVPICINDHTPNSESILTVKISNEINLDLDAAPVSNVAQSQDTPDNLENKDDPIPNDSENKKVCILDNLENKEDSIPNTESVNVTNISNEIMDVNLEDVSVSNACGCQDIPSNNELANNIVSDCSPKIADCEESTSHTSLLKVSEICDKTLNDSNKLACNESNILEKPESTDSNDLQIKISNYTSLSYHGSLNGTESLASSDSDKPDISAECLEQYSEAFPFEMPTQFSSCLTPNAKDNVSSNKMLPTKQRNFRLSHILPPKKTSTVSSRAKRLKLKQKVQKKVSASLERLKMSNATKNSTSCVGSPYDFDESQEEVLSLNSLRINRFRKLNNSYKFLKQPNKTPLIPCVVLIKEKNNVRDKWRVKRKMRDQDNFSESQNLERNETVVNLATSESDCGISQMYKEPSKNIDFSDLNTDQMCSKASHPLKVLNKCPETSVPFCSNSSQMPLQNGHDVLEDSETSTKIDLSSLPSSPLSGHTLDSNTFSKDSNKETVDSNHFESESNSSFLLPSNTNVETTVPCEPSNDNPETSENNTNSVSDEHSEEEAPSRFFQTFVAQSIEVQPVYEDIYSNYEDTSNMRNSDRRRSFMNFPLTRKGLIQFITEVKHHRNPRTYALKVLSKNKTPGSLRALILQLYAYFRICKKRENKLRISKLIKSLDERYARC